MSSNVLKNFHSCSGNGKSPLNDFLLLFCVIHLLLLNGILRESHYHCQRPEHCKHLNKRKLLLGTFCCHCHRFVYIASRNCIAHKSHQTNNVLENISICGQKRDVATREIMDRKWSVSRRVPISSNLAARPRLARVETRNTFNPIARIPSRPYGCISRILIVRDVFPNKLSLSLFTTFWPLRITSRHTHPKFDFEARNAEKMP